MRVDLRSNGRAENVTIFVTTAAAVSSQLDSIVSIFIFQLFNN